MNDADEIVLETMADVLEKIPVEYLDDFLHDLGEWVRFRNFLKPAIEAGLVVVEPRMVWVNDGIPGISEVRVEYEIDQENA